MKYIAKRRIVQLAVVRLQVLVVLSVLGLAFAGSDAGECGGLALSERHLAHSATAQCGAAGGVVGGQWARGGGVVGAGALGVVGVAGNGGAAAAHPGCAVSRSGRGRRTRDGRTPFVPQQQLAAWFKMPQPDISRIEMTAYRWVSAWGYGLLPVASSVPASAYAGPRRWPQTMSPTCDGHKFAVCTSRGEVV